MSTGILKKKIEGKDFGFIAPDGQQPGEKDIFVHKESLVDVTWDEIKENDKVSYDLESSEKGPKAVNVKRV
jgi:CspA family cold shock protein